MEVRFNKVTKGFQGQTVLANVNWVLHDGEQWQITGPSGIGKTTLLRLLLGLESPDDGQIIGHEGVRMTAAFQEHRLCPWLSVRKNVRMVCSAEVTDTKIDQALRVLLPEGSVDQPAGTLSGGMKRRAAIVRALLPDSDLVVLDEPFAELDHENIARALAFIALERRGRTVVLVTHEGYHLPGTCRIKTLVK